MLGDGISFEECKKACEWEQDFKCRSVDYWPGGDGQDPPLECQLSTADSRSKDFLEPCYFPYAEKNIYAEI